MAASASKKQSKNGYRRAKKQEAKHAVSLIRLKIHIYQAKPTHNQKAPSPADEPVRESEPPAANDGFKDHDEQMIQAEDLLEIDGVENQYDFDQPGFEEFKKAFVKYGPPTEEDLAKQAGKAEIYYEEDDIPDEEEETEQKVSKRKRKMMNRPTIAALKASVNKPELVEWTDTASPDPQLLLSLKGLKNAVPVPGHWSLKREYLSSKRGIEKPPFALPKFIQETGISEMRDAVLKKQESMNMAQRQRERVQGKLGKFDMDYNKLYEAFFRRQTKPEMTSYGEVYYEGKEFETNLVHLKPGILSEELKDALGMAPGYPPPWLVNQQRLGPPHSYPHLRIPGVTAPIPPGASWGFQPGQWGKPPVDEVTNRPLWGGDPFGVGILQETHTSSFPGEPVERSLWGTLRADGESEDEESDEEEEEEEEEQGEEGPENDSGGPTAAIEETALPTEIEIEPVGELTLRKELRSDKPDESGAARSAYQVLQEKETQATGFFPGERAYDLDAARRDTFGDSQRKRKAGDVEVSVDVDSLVGNDKLDKEALRKQYEAQKKADMQGQWQSIDQDDLSDMIATESRKRQKREERNRDDNRRARR